MYNSLKKDHITFTLVNDTKLCEITTMYEHFYLFYTFIITTLIKTCKCPINVYEKGTNAISNVYCSYSNMITQHSSLCNRYNCFGQSINPTQMCIFQEQPYLVNCSRSQCHNKSISTFSLKAPNITWKIEFGKQTRRFCAVDFHVSLSP